MTRWHDAIPLWVIQHNNDQLAQTIQLAYHNWVLNAENCRSRGIEPPAPYNQHSKWTVWTETGEPEGAD